MRLICVLLTVFVLGATPAYADDPPKTEEFELVTDCEMIPIEASKKDLCGLTLEEWTRVLKTNATLVSKTRLLKYERFKTGSLERQKTALQTSLEAMADSQKVLTERVDKLTVDLIAKDEKYQNERVKPRLGNPIAWTITATVVALATGFVIKEVLD
jgi:hypothetical protein